MYTLNAVKYFKHPREGRRKGREEGGEEGRRGKQEEKREKEGRRKMITLILHSLVFVAVV